MSPERELEIELKYDEILKRKKRSEEDKIIIDLWEDLQVLKWHGRNP